MTVKMKRLQENGFTLIELMIGVGLLCLIALAAATVAKLADQASHYADKKQEFRAFSAFLMENLKNTDTCSQALGDTTTQSGNNMGGANPSGKANHGNGSHNIHQSGGLIVFLNNVPNLQAGPTMTSQTLDPTDLTVVNRQILPRRLQIDDLRLADIADLGPSGTNDVYLANVYLTAEEIGGMPFRKTLIGAITIYADQTTHQITSCQGMPTDAIQQACTSTSLGCTWNTTTHVCNCQPALEMCLQPGTYPTRFTPDGRVTCEPLGEPSTSVTCPANEFVTELEIGHMGCAPAPSTCPAGTSVNGAGNPVAGLNNCKCNNAGETYYTVGGCQAATSSPPANCPARTLVWTVGTNTCSGAVSQTPNGLNGTVTAGSDSAVFACASGTWAPTPNAGATCSGTTAPTCNGQPRRAFGGCPVGKIFVNCGGMYCDPIAGWTTDSFCKSIGSTAVCP